MGYRTAAGAGLVVLALAGLAAAAAVWLPATGWRSSPPPPRATLADAGAMLANLPGAADARLALAAESTGEGHWTFLNTAGERFTAASADEMKHVVPTLAPAADKPGARLTLLVTEDTVFRHRKLVQQMPLAGDRRTDLAVAVEHTAYPVVRRPGRAGSEQLFAQVRPGVLVELTERSAFDEAIWQLGRPLARATLRVLALEPGGPTTIPSGRRVDPQTKATLTDAIDPPALAAALRSLSGQTVLVTARREGEHLAYRPSSGAERTFSARPVLDAARDADVDLLLLQSATPRQPGTRSWLWQTVAVGRLEDALGREHLADFLAALAAPEGKLLVSVTPAGPGRTDLRATPLKDESSPRTGIGEALSDLVSDFAGRIVVSGVEAGLGDRERQRELARRFVPGVPALAQLAWLGLLALGAAGHVVARRWWDGIWPPESRESYANAAGWLAARLVRSATYLAIFMPLAALLSAPITLAELFRPRSPAASGPAAREPGRTTAPAAGLPPPSADTRRASGAM